MTNLKVIGRKMNELWLLPNLKLVKQEQEQEQQDQDKNYGPVGLKTGGSNYGKEYKIKNSDKGNL